MYFRAAWPQTLAEGLGRTSILKVDVIENKMGFFEAKRVMCI